jgi:UDP-2,3-diacylglucosamine pyrophosphatase LpxH
MRFHRKDKIKKTLLVISDLHLSAGVFFNGKRNILEDFHYDKELVEFLKYYSTGEYSARDVELIINGDFLDFLAVPYIKYFDDEFWSEEGALSKLKIILDAHPEVMEALDSFLLQKNKKIVYILGNHDAEFVFESMRKLFTNCFSESSKKAFHFEIESEGEYSPTDGVLIKHGHEYEVAHQFDYAQSIVKTKDGRNYFLPPWGSYYVTRVINKFKMERSYINAVRPIQKFLINGLIYDTLFTIRLIFANIYYFIMVRGIYFFKQGHSFTEILKLVNNELELFQDYEDVTLDFFNKNPEINTLIVGHNHDPEYRTSPSGSIFINTGTWTKMYNLEFEKKQNDFLLTYAQIDVTGQNLNQSSLNAWKGGSDLPYSDFQS